MLVFFFFKKKTAYEMRMSDWSSDVCSSDLDRRAQGRDGAVAGQDREAREIGAAADDEHDDDDTRLVFRRRRAAACARGRRGRRRSPPRPDLQRLVLGKRLVVRVHFVGRLLLNKKTNVSIT